MKLIVPLFLALAFGARIGVAAPVVFRVMDPVGPGDTVMLYGDGLGPGVKAEGWRVPDLPVSHPPSEAPDLTVTGAQPLEVLQASDICVKILLPTDWKPGLFAIRLTNAAGDSNVIAVNRTEPWWWLGGPNDTAQPGANIRVFGKNFTGDTRAWLAANRSSLPLDRVSSGKYAAEFHIPASVPAGSYRLWVHNGFGGEAGFGAPLEVRVAPAEVWPSTVFNVRDFGAKGDALTDDTAAFAAALAKAGAGGGGVVYIPRGKYVVSAKLVVPPRTTVRGENRDVVWLFSPKDAPPFDAIFAGNHDFAVEDLSIVSQTARRILACPDLPIMYGMPSGHEPPPQFRGYNAHFRRLRLQHLFFAHRLQDRKGDPRRLVPVGPTTVFLVGRDMEVSDCDILSSGMPLGLMHPYHCVITGNRIDNGRNGHYCMWNASEDVFENNIVEGRDMEATYGGFQQETYRLYIAGNTFRDAYGDEREAICFDTPYFPKWMGRIASVQGVTLAVCDYSGAPKTWLPGELRGEACLIAYGKGLGQYIPITDNSATTITLAHPFAVTPDATSHLVVRDNKTEVVVADNQVTDASVAVQFYAQMFGCIVDGNRGVRTGGAYGFGGDQLNLKGRRYSTCCFNQWLDNDISQSFVYQQGPYLDAIIGPCVTTGTLEPPAIPVFGNVIRGNHARDWTTIGAFYSDPHPFAPSHVNSAGYAARDTIIEDNNVADTPVGIAVGLLYRDTVVRNNRVKNSPVPFRDDGVNTWISPAERLGYQIQAAADFLGPKADLSALRTTSANATASDEAAIRQQLWAAIARASGGRISPELLMALTGCWIGIDPSALLVAADSVGGNGQIDLQLRTAPWSPRLAATLKLQIPPAWQLKTSPAPVVVDPCTVSTFKSNIVIPPGNNISTLPADITISLEGVPGTGEMPPLTVELPLDLSRRAPHDQLP